jgi:hypothetical protein
MALILMSARMFETSDTIMELDALPDDDAISGRWLTEHCHERGAAHLGASTGKAHGR